MRIVLSVVAVMIVAAGGGWYAWTTSKPVVFRAACEDAIRERLVVAGSYVFEEASPLYEDPATFDDLMGWGVATKKREDQALARSNRKVARSLEQLKADFASGLPRIAYTMFVTYEGRRHDIGLLSGPSICSFVAPAGARITRSGLKGRMRVDGYTALEHAAHALGRVSR